MTTPTPAPDDDHTSDGRCKYPATCAAEGRHADTPTPAPPAPTEPSAERDLPPAVERCRRLHGLEPGYVMGCDECESPIPPGRDQR